MASFNKFCETEPEVISEGQEEKTTLVEANMYCFIKWYIRK